MTLHGCLYLRVSAEIDLGSSQPRLPLQKGYQLSIGLVQSRTGAQKGFMSLLILKYYSRVTAVAPEDLAVMGPRMPAWHDWVNLPFRQCR